MKSYSLEKADLKGSSIEDHCMDADTLRGAHILNEECEDFFWLNVGEEMVEDEIINLVSHEPKMSTISSYSIDENVGTRSHF